MKADSWVDARLFSFADLVRLTGYAPSRIHGFVARGQFRPQYPQPHGGARGAERRSYSARDVLRLQLLGPILKFGVHLRAGDRYGGDRQTLAALMNELDTYVTQAASNAVVASAERLVFPREHAPWCYLVLDLVTLASTNCRRVAEYRRMRDEGIEPSQAARDSLTAVARAIRTSAQLTSGSDLTPLL